MSVSGISGNSATTELAALMRSQRSSTSTVDAAASGDNAARADSAKFSGPAEFLSKLQELKETDPEKFKELVQSAADQLKSAAESETDERARKMLTTLADKIASVADSGDLSQLEPPKPPSLSANGQKSYGMGDNSDQKMMAQAMGQPQGPPPGPPPGDAQGSGDDGAQSASSSGSDLRSTLKSIFDELNESLTQALAQ